MMTAYSEPMKIASPTLHATILLTISVFIAILVMSFVFKVEVVARGAGRVVPVSRVQVVQPEFSGRIIAIHVRNGTSVNHGDILIELDPTEAMAELGTILAEQERLLIELARIDAMVGALGHNPDDLDFVSRAESLFDVPAALSGHPYKEEQRNLLNAEVANYLASLAQIAAHEKANRRSEAVTGANIDRVNAALDIQAERLRMSEQLLQKG